MKKNLLKLKIESIAQKLFNTNQSYNNDLKEETNINQLSSDESTIKDSLSEFEELSKSINNSSHKNQRNKNNNFTKTQKNKSIQNNRHSSLCTKMTSLTEHNTINGTLEYNNNESNKQSSIKNKNDENVKTKNNNKTTKELFDKNEIAKINKVNIYKINNLKDIYLDLLELFNIQLKKNEKSKELYKELSNDIKLLSYKYINFVFSEDMELLINIFSNITEIHKYLIIEIYFFISVIYLFDENTLSNNYLMISYKTAIFYSILNFQNILNILNTSFSLVNDALINKIKSINKILLPTLKLINPNVPSNNQIKEFISQNNIINSNNNLGIIKLVSSLKENANLISKLNELKKLDDKTTEEKNIKREIKFEKQINPLLPLMNKKKFKFSIAIELDETLVHYCEEGDNYYAKVRFGTENFLKNISNFFEIIVVSTSGKEYSNIIIDNLNKENKCYVEHRLFIEDFSEKQDLTNINRDLRKIIFVCHDYDFINAPKENIILLKEFLGEEEDREIVKLYSELKQFINDYDSIDEDNFDIRNEIPKIMERIYLNFGNLDLLDDEEDEK
jgi:hypothetical protein